MLSIGIVSLSFDVYLQSDNSLLQNFTFITTTILIRMKTQKGCRARENERERQRKRGKRGKRVSEREREKERGFEKRATEW